MRAKAGSPDNSKLVPHRIYIRRAGPCSEEPRSSEEWDRFFERCLQNRRAELLDAMRSIMAGVLPTAATDIPTRLDQLIAFNRRAFSRWETLIAFLPPETTPRFPHGHYDISFAIDGNFETKSLKELNVIIGSAVRNHSGWPPFLTLNRHPFMPKPVDGAIECWIGPDTDGSYERPARHDFWRVSPEGLLFTRRGYSEDGGYEGTIPGKLFDITTPAWRVGEAILEASYIAQALAATDANLICHCHWTGLKDRTLASRGNPSRIMFGSYVIAQDTHLATETVALSALPDALPDFVHAILSPLYELFDFFLLPKNLVENEIASLQRNRF